MAGWLYVDQAKLTIPKVTIYYIQYARYTYLCIPVPGALCYWTDRDSLPSRLLGNHLELHQSFDKIKRLYNTTYQARTWPTYHIARSAYTKSTTGIHTNQDLDLIAITNKITKSQHEPIYAIIPKKKEGRQKNSDTTTPGIRNEKRQKKQPTRDSNPQP